MTDNQSKDDGLLLNGLDASNQLAFLAALGTLRTLSIALPERNVKMKWQLWQSAWRPRLVVDVGDEISQEECLQLLENALAKRYEEHPISQLQKKDEALENADASLLNWISAMSSDFASDAVSQLQMVRKDYFIGNLRSIITATTREHLMRALFQLWDYADPLENQSLHLDPTEDRRHAYQWNKPSKDPTRKKCGGMLGANRMALEALPLFQSFGTAGGKMSTSGFRGNRIDNTYWTWPVWNCPINRQVVQSLITSQILQMNMLEAEKLKPTGIAAVYKCRRILVGKTPNFSPATAII